jgi:hypothetical protein
MLPEVDLVDFQEYPVSPQGLKHGFESRRDHHHFPFSGGLAKVKLPTKSEQKMVAEVGVD